MKVSSRDRARELAIPVAGDGAVSLVPVGAWILEDDDLITSMAKWRFAARGNYFVQFPYSPQSMRRYLEAVSIADPATLLFIIERDHSDVIGHVGLRHVSEAGAEIDSVMRNLEGPAGWIKPSLRVLIAWSFDHLGVRRLTLRVISSNERAIALYRKLGFGVVREVPLRSRWERETLHLEEADAGQEPGSAEKSVHMALTRPYPVNTLHG